MARYCIVSAKPRGATNHLKSEFKLLVEGPNKDWGNFGWKSITDICSLIDNGHSVLTGEISGNNLNLGAPVEAELRISRNDTNYKISSMPDK